LYRTDTTEQAKSQICRWLGEHPAIYFYKDVPTETLNRFFLVQRWLMQTESKEFVFDVVDKMRSEFWDNDVLHNGNTLTRLARRQSSLTSVIEKLPDHLTQAEVLIENYERLRGFELEMRTMRLAFGEWSNLIDKERLNEAGLGIIVDRDEAKEYHRRIMRMATA
jgi:hypothetical protein